MVTLLASLAGFITSIIPEVLKIFKDFNDKKHHLQVLEKQIEYGKFNNIKSFHKTQFVEQQESQSSLYSTYKSGIGWVDALNGSVRPMLAYSFFMMYAGVKIVQYLTINHTTTPPIGYIDIIWSIDDQAIFASIISFYFGQRTFNKVWKNKV